ncbi:MAG: hypothetical protein ACREIT_00565 [Tepidisphaeraceae bacterium]
MASTASLADAPRGRWAAQIRAECDQLVRDAVRRPYGWAWGEIGDGAGGVWRGGKPPARGVAMDPLTTPAAGLVLYWAGRELGDDVLFDAARQAARGVAAAQLPTGQVKSRPLFGPTVGRRDSDEGESVIPNRAATRAALGLLLILLDDQPDPPDEQLGRCVTRALHWLQTQQTGAGGWPVMYPSDTSALDVIRLGNQRDDAHARGSAPGARASVEPRRVLRLDDPDFRDCTLAMLLGHEVTGNAAYLSLAQKSIAQLLMLRIGSPARAGRNLWATVYDLRGDRVRNLPDVTEGTNALATRYAIQTLLAAYLSTGDRKAAQAADVAARGVAALRHPTGLWDLYTDPRSGDPVGRHDPASTQPSVFGATQPALISDAWTSGTFGLDVTLHATSQMKALGREKYLAMLSPTFEHKHQMALALCGLRDQPSALDLPVSSQEVAAYVVKHADAWATLEGPVPADLAGRVRRAWLLLLRLRLDRMGTENGE